MRARLFHVHSRSSSTLPTSGYAEDLAGQPVRQRVADLVDDPELGPVRLGPERLVHDLLGLAPQTLQGRGW